MGAGLSTSAGLRCAMLQVDIRRLNGSSPLYAYIQGWGLSCRCMWRLPLTGQPTRFTGVTKVPRERQGVRGTGCRRLFWIVAGATNCSLQRRISTSPQTSFRERHDAGWNEAQVIDAFYAAGGGVVATGLLTLAWCRYRGRTLMTSRC